MNVRLAGVRSGSGARMGCDCAQVLYQVPRWSALTLAAVVLLACGRHVEDGVPTDLRGRWITSEPKYHDRYLEIQPDRLIWGVGKFELYNHPIEKVESQPETDKQTRYWLHYTEAEGYPDALELLLHRTARLAIRFTNRPEVWIRAPPG